jgi:penicillin-binding protein 1C
MRLKIKIISYLVGAVILALIVGTAIQLRQIPSFRDVKAGYRASDRVVLDRHGQIIDEFRLEKRTRRLQWVPLEKVAPSLPQAIVHAQDRRFYTHLGFDPIVLVHSLWHPGLPNETLSMQVADELTGDHPFGPQRPGQILLRALRASVLELTWSKHDILEAYMNLITYRVELQGVAAASFALFEKAPLHLSPSESALLVALIHSPTVASESVRTRACEILAGLHVREECGMVGVQHLSYLERAYAIRPYVHMAPHMAERLAKIPEIVNKGGLVRSTLDRSIQWTALQALQRQGTGGVIVLDNRSGNVLAYLSSDAASPDEVLRPQPAGATLLPWMYAKALDERVLTASTALEDSPLAMAWHKRVAKNNTTVSVREALVGNLNIPAVRALQLLGADSFVQTLKDLGLSESQKAEDYGPSLALGMADVRLMDLTNAYRALANAGEFSPLRISPDVMSEQESKRVISPAAAFITTTLLSDPGSKYWAAVKCDGPWCLGFSERFTVGVRTSGAPLIAWREVMDSLQANDVSHTPPVPETAIRVDTPSGPEWYVAGTEPTVPSDTQSRISYPMNQSVIAMDRDLPRPSDRVFIQVVAPKSNQNLYLNGQRLGRAHPLQPWEPRAGQYTLELRDSQGQVLDTVQFVVRGHSFAARLLKSPSI